MLRRQVYSGIGKRFFAGEVLGDQASRGIRVPARLRPWCEEVSSRQTAALEAAGYHVEGSLTDLRCAGTAFTDEVEKAREREVSRAAVAALARILTMRAAEQRSAGPRLARTRALAGRLRAITGKR